MNMPKTIDYAQQIEEIWKDIHTLEDRLERLISEQAEIRKRLARMEDRDD